MSNVSLVCHPETPAREVRAIDVSFERRQSGLWLRYFVDCELDALALPLPATPARADGLWRTTCFEAFLKPAGGDAYVELNFSPSREWAAYAFTGYRQGMAAFVMAAPDIGLDASESHFALEAETSLPPALAEHLDVGLSVVIEEVSGAKSYWALAHGDGPPDFHRGDCFRLRLPPPEAA